MTDPVRSLDTLTFTVDQLKQILLQYWCMRPPASEAVAGAVLDMLLGLELSQQRVEARGRIVGRLPAPR